MRRASAGLMALALVFALPAGADSARSRFDSDRGHRNFSNDWRRDARDSHHNSDRSYERQQGFDRNSSRGGSWRGNDSRYWGFNERFRGTSDPYWDGGRYSRWDDRACPRAYYFRDRFGRLHRADDCRAVAHDARYFLHNRYGSWYGGVTIEIPFY
jgi:hypothetical protein